MVVSPDKVDAKIVAPEGDATVTGPFVAAIMVGIGDSHWSRMSTIDRYSGIVGVATRATIRHIATISDTSDGDVAARWHVMIGDKG